MDSGATIKLLTLGAMAAGFAMLLRAWKDAPPPVSNLTFSNVGSGVATEAGSQGGPGAAAAAATAAQMANTAALLGGADHLGAVDWSRVDPVVNIVISSGIFSPSQRAGDQP